MAKKIEDDIIELENQNESGNYGLYHGKMGLCMIFFAFARYENDERYKIKAEALLDDVIENIESIEHYDFESGLLGIGWAIEWLVQNDFLTINTHEYLADLDDEVYKLIMSTKADRIDLKNGTLGRALYLLKRLQAVNYQDFFREVCIKECMVLLMDELYEMVLTQENAILKQEVIKMDGNTQVSLANTLIFLDKILPLRYNYDLAHEMTYKIIEIITQLGTSSVYPYAGIYLNSSLYKIAQSLRSETLQTKARSACEFYANVEKINNPQVSYAASLLIAEQISPYHDISVFSILQSIPDLDQTRWQEAWLLQ